MRRRLRDRLAELEARVAELEAHPPVEMPPRPYLDTLPTRTGRPLVDPHPPTLGPWWEDDDTPEWSGAGYL